MTLQKEKALEQPLKNYTETKPVFIPRNETTTMPKNMTE